MSAVDSPLLRKFEAHQITPGTFHHSDHVQVAFEMLRKYSFLEATWRYVETIRALADRAGAPDHFHVTITLAFLSLIAERMTRAEYTDYQHFILENEDLDSTDVLSRVYSSQRLQSDLARRIFLLPDGLEPPTDLRRSGL